MESNCNSTIKTPANVSSTTKQSASTNSFPLYKVATENGELLNSQITQSALPYINLLICNIRCNDCIILIKGDSKFTSCLQSIQTKNYFEQIIYLMLSKVYIENVSSIFINKLTKYKINIFFFRLY